MSEIRYRRFEYNKEPFPQVTNFGRHVFFFNMFWASQVKHSEHAVFWMDDHFQECTWLVNKASLPSRDSGMALWKENRWNLTVLSHTEPFEAPWENSDTSGMQRGAGGREGVVGTTVSPMPSVRLPSRSLNTPSDSQSKRTCGRHHKYSALTKLQQTAW